ncbi:MAG: PilZ domain-containing protein [Roseibium sp.]
MNTQATNVEARKNVPAQVVDFSDMSFFEATAYDVSDDGCWIVSDKIDLLKGEVGLRLPGRDRLVRGTVVAFGDDEAKISFDPVEEPQERRREERRPVLITASVSSPDSTSTMKCKIVDASKSGCRLESEKISQLPGSVEISIPDLNIPIIGKIVWRSINQAGISFIWPDEPSHENVSDDVHARKQRKRVSAFGD